MTRSLFIVAASLLAPSAWATEAQPETVAETPVPEVPPPAAPLQAPSPPAVITPPAPAAVATTTVTPEPEPYTGWGRGVRAPIYVNLMLAAGGYGEDGDNRLTTRDSKLLEGFGGLFRVGAVLDPHHRLGGRVQSFVRPTKKIAPDIGSTAMPTDEWGAVTFGFVGPEYLYTTDLGIYAAAAAGVGFAMSKRELDSDDDRHTEKASAGVASMLSLGYEWRANKWFAMNTEVFAGLYHGVDDNENSMNGGLFGIAMGAGF